MLILLNGEFSGTKVWNILCGMWINWKSLDFFFNLTKDYRASNKFTLEGTGLSEPIKVCAFVYMVKKIHRE